MSAKHTPGPWKVRKHWSDEGAYEVFPERGGKPKFGEWSAIAEVTDSVSTNESAKANARLIAAAPDLLFQLLAASNYIDALGGDSKSYRAAIAKATGQEGGAA